MQAMRLHTRLLIGLPLVAALTLLVTQHKTPKLSDAALKAQTGDTTSIVSYGSSQMLQGQQFTPGVQYYFRCPSTMTPITILSPSLNARSDTYVWGYEFSGNEMVNSYFSSDQADIWDGQYFISQAYVLADNANSIYDEVQILRGGTWYSLTTNKTLHGDCLSGFRLQSS